eukprot:356316-Chlamydomonas_euryale.AAC.1
MGGEYGAEDRKVGCDGRRVYGTVQRVSAVRCGTVQRASAVRCSTVQRASAVRCSTVQRASAVRCGTVQRASAVRCSTVQRTSELPTGLPADVSAHSPCGRQTQYTRYTQNTVRQTGTGPLCPHRHHHRVLPPAQSRHGAAPHCAHCAWKGRRRYAHACTCTAGEQGRQSRVRALGPEHEPWVPDARSWSRA